MANLSQKGALGVLFADVCDQKFLDTIELLRKQSEAFSGDPNISHNNTFEHGIVGP